ncbi:poly(ADP-ribosyl)transferase [Tieghemostelium lacteum]|uniref:Poly [ADP-ribose] polymerase n=1 Tax=Tieghemostelium lacteum TaxID=361077 RepID=A0A151ZDS5_TIELA|nr:poly(ADP-ribosyl)transferase [Tieghemostelium lacteum]|eukprot:KYQ92097.1 poly(ADP-ribosyl)transferase [Tieghemostelium lacteum]
MSNKEELKTSVEYSKSNRSSCKKCKGSLPVDSIRIGLETKSRVWDGYDVYWYHVKCFQFSTVHYLKQLKHFDLLRWEDQMKLRELIGDKSEIKNQMEKENYYNDIWKIKDSLAAELKPAQIKTIVPLNYQLDSLSPAQVLHVVAEGMSYGRVGPCPNCNCLTVLFDGEGYYCKGWVSSFSRCDWFGPECKRYRFQLPKDGKLKSKFLSSYTFPHHHPFEELSSDYKPPAHVNSGNGEGASVTSEDGTTSSDSGIFKFRANPPSTGSALLKINEEFSQYSSASKEIVIEQTQEYGYQPYNISLSMTDLMTNNNSYYILQLIKSGKSYYCFCKWGRVGQKSGSGGGATDHKFSTLAEALDEFKEKFLDKTGCNWDLRSRYSKLPGKYFVVELDESDAAHSTGLETSIQQMDIRESTLPPRVQSLVQSIFDEKLMKQQLANLQFDSQKMPLGKISLKQVQMAYKILTEIQDLIEQPTTTKSQFSDASSRFYTMIPHSFGFSAPPLIDNKKLLLEKMKLVDMMSEIEVINTLKQRLAASSSGNSLDDQYTQLKSAISPVDKDSYLYRKIEEMSLSTVDETEPFTVEIMDIYECKREGEEQRYIEKWEYNHNKMMLWHGSRNTNFAGILSQGLRIAPKESPKTGYRFGKGVYLADCLSVSAGYCGTTRDNPYGIVALSEVALGSSEALTQDQYMEKANDGYGSTKAMGSRSPSTFDDFNGISMMKGPIITHPVQSSVTHSEYVVYDVTQINIKYLLMIKINQK